MFQTAPGVTIPFPEKIQEQFQVYDGQSIQANISFEKLKSLLTEFYQSLPEPLFLYCNCHFLFKKNDNLGMIKFHIKKYAVLTDRHEVKLILS